MRSNENSRVFAATFVAIFAVLLLVAPLPVHAQTYTVFTPPIPTPNGDLITDVAGNLYGTSDTQGGGGVFKLDPSGVGTVLHELGCDDTDNGCESIAGLFRDSEGNLYGTTTAGGNTAGTIFKLDVNNTLTILHEFEGGNEGGGADSRLVSINGELYGTTEFGGTSGCEENAGCGMIFKITKEGVFTTMYRFTGGADGATPQGLIRDGEGNLYGATTSTVFKFDTAGVFSVLHTFGASPGDGSDPVGRLTLNTANGALIGATRLGGTCCGVVYRLDASGNETILHNFAGGKEGKNPTAGLLDVDGVFYGTTVYGGDLGCNVNGGGVGCGVLYQIGKTGKYTILHRFLGGNVGDGAYPLYGGLTLGVDGSIYGATRKGGAGGTESSDIHGGGVIFKYTPAEGNETEEKP
jgi:uncharacterized repeat protein (TIGR03803 family)